MRHMHSAVSRFISCNIFSVFGVGTPDRDTMHALIEVSKLKKKVEVSKWQEEMQRGCKKREIRGGKAMRDGSENKNSR